MTGEQGSETVGAGLRAGNGGRTGAVGGPSTEQELRSDVFSVTRRADGVLVIRHTESVTLTLEHARAQIAACLDVAAGELPVPLLVVLGPAKGITGEARRYLSRSPEAKRAFSRAAFVVGSPVSRVMATVFLRLNRPPMPSRIFSDQDDALAWLRQGPA